MGVFMISPFPDLSGIHDPETEWRPVLLILLFQSIVLQQMIVLSDGYDVVTSSERGYALRRILKIGNIFKQPL